CLDAQSDIAVQTLTDTVMRCHLDPLARDALVDALLFVLTWRPDRIDLSTITRLAELSEARGYRARLLVDGAERAIFSDPSAITADLVDRLSAVYSALPEFRYALWYIAGRPDAPWEARARACDLSPSFPLHETIAHRLGGASVRALMVQNVADGQGDEMVRTVPLMQAMLDFNPDLRIVLITDRTYLYSHPRIEVVSFDDRDRITQYLSHRFDALINFFEPNVPENCCDLWVEMAVRQLDLDPPFLSVWSSPGRNDGLFWKVDVDGRQYVRDLRLDRARASSVYEPTCRLIAELGWPTRMGEEPSLSGSVLAGKPCADAELAWRDATSANIQGRPVALLHPFGGADRLKGFADASLTEAAKTVDGLIAEGFFVLLMANGTPWGSAEKALAIRDALPAGSRPMVALAPDPASDLPARAHACTGRYPLPYVSYVMHLYLYFIQRAELVVTVEGWMVHAATFLGRPQRIFLMPTTPISGQWHPYGRSAQQRLVSDLAGQMELDGGSTASLLTRYPRAFLAQMVLRSFRFAPDERLLPSLFRVLDGDDRNLRLAAIDSLSAFPGAEIDARLRSLLNDRWHNIRACAAEALLARCDGASESGDPDFRGQLRAHILIHNEPRNWQAVIDLGPAALPALRIAVNDVDEYIRREAAQVLRSLQRATPGSLEATPQETPQTGNSGGIRGLFFSRIATRRGNLESQVQEPAVLILTPLKDARDHLKGYTRLLGRLTYPHDRISLGFLEGDSTDQTFQHAQGLLPALNREFRRARLWKKDFGYALPPDMPRGAAPIQRERRTFMARSRNHLLFHALDDEDWVLWLDVDLVEYPADIVQRLLATGKDIVQPHCVLEYGGRTFDGNAWRERGRLHMDDLRSEGDLVELDSVGGTMLLVRADLHRDGLVFPAFGYGVENERIRWDRSEPGEVETEGLGMLARDMGYRCWGMPNLEILHANS
ncbi:MAG: hypothetical protein ACRDFX_10975, partial [Chloroflexota bacterium]